MNNANDAELRIGGSIDELKAATEKAAVEVKKMADQMQSSLGGLNSAFQKIHGTFMAFTAALAGGAAFKSVISASSEWTGQVGGLAKSLGITTERASVMNVALNHVGLSADMVAGATQKLAKEIQTNGQAFEVLGVKVKDSSGQYRPAVDIMAEVNDKLREIKNPIEQAIAGQQVYGKGWAEIRPILKLTSEQMRDAEERAKQLHLIVGPEGEAMAKQYKTQLRDLNLVGKSLEVQFGNAVMPVFVKLGKFMGEEAPAMGNAFKNVLESIGFAASAVWLALKDMGDGLGAMAAQAAALLRGDLAAFREIGRLRDEEAAKNEAAYERMKAAFGEDIPAAKSNEPEFGGPTYDFGKDGKGAADKSRVSKWETELAETKVFFQKQYELREYSKQQEKEYWQSILRNVNVTGQERIAITRKVSELELEIIKKQVQQKRALDSEAINAREKAAEGELQMEELQAQREYDLGNISKAELLALQQQFEDRRFEIQQQAQADRIAALLGDPNMDPVALQKLLDQMTGIQSKHALDVAKIQKEAAVEAKTEWEKMLSPVSSAFEKSITGIVQGTQTFQRALANIFNSIFAEFVSLLSKMVVKWAAMELAKTVETQKGSVLRTLLEKAGLIETSAAQVTASATTSAAKKVEAGATIPAEAAEAAGAAASAVAGIPVVGPALAAAAYAETMAMVMGGLAVASASGGFDIPAGINPLTQLHEREMVLPAEHADTIRSLQGGGARGDNHNYYITALDARSFERFLHDNKRAVAGAVKSAYRDGFKPA